MTGRIFEHGSRSAPTVPAAPPARISRGNALRYAAAVVRFVLIWCGAYLGAAAIVLLAWLFST